MTDSVLDTPAMGPSRWPTTPPDECRCGLSGDDEMCINGEVFGPCGVENCGGVCVYESDCTCACHKQEAA